jgi:antitoxin YefM
MCPHHARWAVLALIGHQVLVILMTMTTLPLGEVKSHLSELVGRVHDHHERVTVTVHGRPSAVLVALEDLEQLEETLAILRYADTMGQLAHRTPNWPAASPSPTRSRTRSAQHRQLEGR